MPGKKGFSLIELLVVISIIAVLSVVGMVVYSSISQRVRDSKRVQDINSIASAQEVKYSQNNRYSALTSADFSSGILPKDPADKDYYTAIADDGSWFKVCSTLEGNSAAFCNTSSSSCYCKTSSLSQMSNNSTYSGTGSYIGLGGYNLIHSASCDSTGTLGSNLVGYWRLDESSWSNNCTTSSVIDSSGSNNNGRSCPAGTGISTLQSGLFGNAGSFDGIDDNILLSNNINFSGYSEFTISAWIKVNDTAVYKSIFNNGHGVNFALNPSEGFHVSLRGNGSAGLNWYRIDGSTTGLFGEVWHHVVLVYISGSNFRIYVDGLPNGTNNQSVVYAHSGSSASYIGSTNSGFGNYPFSGVIDDVRIYNKALSLTEVTNLFNDRLGCIP